MKTLVWYKRYNMLQTKTVWVCFMLLISSMLWSQNEEQTLSKAKKQYQEKQFASAEKNYREITGKKTNFDAISHYNMGNSMYKMNQYSEALLTFFKATELAKTKEEKHKAYHNLGNALMKEKDYESAVESYKNALRNNPTDEETRYNFALAKKFLKENPPKNPPRINGENKKPEDDKNPDKDKGKNKDKEKDNGTKQPNEGTNPEQENKPVKQKNQSSEDLLNLLNESEKQVQKRINESKEQNHQKVNDKDW